MPTLEQGIAELARVTALKLDLKAKFKEQKFQDALAQDRLRDAQRELQEVRDSLKYELALQDDIKREQFRTD